MPHDSKWIEVDNEMQSERIQRLASRVSLITGLDAILSTEQSSSEQFQVWNLDFTFSLKCYGH